MKHPDKDNDTKLRGRVQGIFLECIQPYERAVAGLVREYAELEVSPEHIVHTYRAYLECEKALRKNAPK